MTRIKSEILVVGGGPAGLSAALAASNRAGVTLIDDNPLLGGQIWRAELGTIKSSVAASLIEKTDARKINILTGIQVFGSDDANRLLAIGNSQDRLELDYEVLIIATGARERFLPFPGWTLPGVYGAGGLQALVKGGFTVENKRVVLAGTGPLLLAVADHLKAKRAHVIAIAEQAPQANINRF